MTTTSLAALARYCDRHLRTDQFEDWPGAVNGLQVENRGQVSHIAAAVDGTLATIQLAIAAQADLLLVHHGLFWSQAHPWTGRRYQLFGLLWQHNLAVYSSHLPLDAHPRWGNNILLSTALGLKKRQPFFLEKGRYLGFQGELNLRREALAARLSRILGKPPLLLPGGPSLCRRVGVVTGGAGGELKRAAAEGVDTFITGEGPHWTYALAEELGVNAFYGGHYATETFGVKALAAHLAARFHLSWEFLDYPTGL